MTYCLQQLHSQFLSFVVGVSTGLLVWLIRKELEKRRKRSVFLKMITRELEENVRRLERMIDEPDECHLDVYITSAWDAVVNSGEIYTLGGSDILENVMRAYTLLKIDSKWEEFRLRLYITHQITDMYRGFVAQILDNRRRILAELRRVLKILKERVK